MYSVHRKRLHLPTRNPHQPHLQPVRATAELTVIEQNCFATLSCSSLCQLWSRFNLMELMDITFFLGINLMDAQIDSEIHFGFCTGSVQCKKKRRAMGKKSTAQSSSISILSVLVDADLSSSASTEWDRSERFRWKNHKEWKVYTWQRTSPPPWSQAGFPNLSPAWWCLRHAVKQESLQSTPLATSKVFQCIAF